MLSPEAYYGAMIELIKERRGIDISTVHSHTDGKVMITSFIPWQEVVCDMNDQVKHFSSGYATFNYEEAGFSPADLVKVEIAVNGDVCEPLSFVCHGSKAVSTGRNLAQKLKEEISRQQFEIIIQAKIGSKVSAK